MTLEEAQAKIVELQEQLTATETERDTLKSNIEQLNSDLARVRELNQRYFEKLSQQITNPAETEKSEPAPTCEEFARNLTI